MSFKVTAKLLICKQPSQKTTRQAIFPRPYHCQMITTQDARQLFNDQSAYYDVVRAFRIFGDKHIMLL